MFLFLLKFSEIIILENICVFVFYVEIKRLVEKEDWVVDNEGLIFLVSWIFFLLVISVYYIE